MNDIELIDIDQNFVAEIWGEAEMAENVGAQNGLRDFGNAKCPTVWPAEGDGACPERSMGTPLAANSVVLFR